MAGAQRQQPCLVAGAQGLDAADPGLAVSDAEPDARRQANPVTPPTAERGYRQPFLKTVTQADKGVDFDLLRAAETKESIPRKRD